jgi:hypothetical protein
MKALPKKLLPLTLFGIAVTALFSVRPAQAGFIVTLEEGRNKVVATGSGAIDLTGWDFFENGFGLPTLINGRLPQIQTGPPQPITLYNAPRESISGPRSFGAGGTRPASSSSSGDV